MKRWIGISVLAVAACSSMDEGADPSEGGEKDQQHVKNDMEGGKAEAWGVNDNPGSFSPNLEYRLAELPMVGEAQNIPWASSYWPVAEDSVNVKWDGSASESASAKYGRAYGVTGVEDAVSLHHGIDGQKGARTACTANSQCNSKIGEACAKRSGQTQGVCIPTWWGICHAWAPASMLVPEAKYPVTRNGVTFKVNDIKALVSLVHNSTETKFVSLRCDKSNDAGEISFDNYGRPGARDPECIDTNPGTYHVLLTNYLGKMRQSFVEDRTFDDQVWNQPLRGYSITRQVEVTAAQANALIGNTTVTGATVSRTGQVQAGAWNHLGAFPVAAGQVIKVVMSGNGDADLYVNFGSNPTAQAYACRPYLGNAAETCETAVPAGATQAFVSVNGYEAAGFSLQITTGVSGPTTYAFNSKAAKLYDVALSVKYISESASTVDGNLAADIDKYTKTDNYEYILEVDAAGRVIGGEWKGGSKKNHPDFVWLPVTHRGESVAGGKITFANVKSLLDESLLPPGGAGGTPRTVTDKATLTTGGWKTYGPYNVAAGSTLNAVMTGNGDADLYVRTGAAPTLTSHDCRPYLDGSGESCGVVGPGQVFVSVNGYAATSTYDLRITYTEGGGSGGTTPPVFNHLNVTNGSVALKVMKVYDLPIPAGKRVVIRTTAPKDVDLYLQMGADPTTTSNLAKSESSSGNETLSFTASQNGTLKIGVYGYVASTFTLKTTDL